jgi:hypothetical protein
LLRACWFFFSRLTLVLGVEDGAVGLPSAPLLRLSLDSSLFRTPCAIPSGLGAEAAVVGLSESFLPELKLAGFGGGLGGEFFELPSFGGGVGAVVSLLGGFGGGLGAEEVTVVLSGSFLSLLK